MKKKMKIDFSPPLIEKEEIKEVVKTLKSGWITSGPKVDEFEKKFAHYIGARYAVALSSGSAGLFLSLVVAGVKKGDEVITSPYTFSATANAIVHAGAKPVFADVQEKTFNIDPEEIEKKITKRTKAIIAVHFAGLPCDMDKIKRVAKRKKLIVIEDASHAIEARYKKRKIGSISELTVFSFHAVKNLTTAEGGMVTTNSKNLAEKIRVLANHGLDKTAWSRKTWSYTVLYPGYKHNMTDIAASLGLWQLKKIEKHYQKRLSLYKAYSKGLKDVPGIILPEAKTNGRHALHLYPLIINFAVLKIKRDNFIKLLAKKGIASNVHYSPIHLFPFYKKTFSHKKGDFPVAEYLSAHEVTLPLHLKMNLKDIKYITSTIKKIAEWPKKRKKKTK